MTHDQIPRDVRPALPLFDEDVLDIADYLKADPESNPSDIHTDATRRRGLQP